MEPVLFEKLHDIKLSCSVFLVTTFFQFDSTKVALTILLQYAHNFNENLKTLCSKLVINNVFDSRSHNKREVSCLTLLYLTQVLSNLQTVNSRSCN